MAAVRVFTTREREELFLQLASRPEGATAREVYEAALAQGDKATPEAYYNLARRLTHRGLIVPDNSARPTRYKPGQAVDSVWLDEEELAAWVSDEYPLLALPVWKESQRQLRHIPEQVWTEVRERLMSEPARQLFRQAIMSYCDELDALLREVSESRANGADSREISRLKEQARNALLLLNGLVCYGLGLPIEAVRLPVTVDQALTELESDKNAKPVRWDESALESELAKRVSDEPFIVEVSESQHSRLLVAAIDGSTRGGVLSFLGEETDFYVGYAPMISINTAVGQVNRSIFLNGQEFPAFSRLPEKPEDVQQRDNRYTVMAKLFYPDLSDAEFMHSLWNAMDALESRVALRVMGRWYTPKGGVEVPPADVVLRDGTVVPQDRDFNHYKDESRYGEIVRDIVATNWDIAMKCLADDQTVAGVVKTAQLRVFGPVVNWHCSHLAAQKRAALIEAWPLAAMNALPDQVLLSRLLTAGRRNSDQWSRTCLALRPFHATYSQFAAGYSTAKPPADIIIEKRDAELKASTMGATLPAFWRDFRGKADPYVQLLNNVWYAGFYLASVPRLDFERYLPRLEFIVPAPTYSVNADPFLVATAHLNRLCVALRQIGFQVSGEHSMYRDKSSLEVLPELISRVHDTVKIWARELMSRVDEYLSTVMARHIATKKMRGVRVRPFTKEEFRLLHEALIRERQRLSGSSGQRTFKRQ